jgi:hypothetical protein
MSDGNAFVALTLGLGGGVALAYLRRDEDSPAPAVPAGPPTAKQPRTERACSLRLDAKGLVADGQVVDVTGAVARCKAAGRAELIFAKDGPAAVYVELHRALSRAGIPVRVSGG